jgi:uncharacterized membrane protein YhaH (DUF805 family)
MDWTKFLFSFNGRVSRKGFWLFFVASLVIGLIIQFAALGPMMAAASSGDAEAMANMSMPVWVWIVFIPLIWMSLAVQAKRWHDQDKSAWWILIGFIPFVGGLIVLIMCGFIAGTPGPNRFGDSVIV